MKKWLLAGIALLVLVCGYVAAGPYLAIRGIERCLETRELDELHRFVDFEALRGNLRAQIDERLLAAAGNEVRGPLAEAAATVVGRISDYTVDAIVSPRGIAILLEGRALARRATGTDERSNATAPDAPYRPLEHADSKFESASRFTATVPSASGAPVVFVFTRDGLSWRLSDIRLPDGALPTG